MSTSDNKGLRMICPYCHGAGSQQRATAGVGRDGQGYTLLHPYECRPCGGEGWISLASGPPV